jgi:hypothetical protein
MRKVSLNFSPLCVSRALKSYSDTKREATSGEVDELRQENEQLKQVVAELLLKNRMLKKSAVGRESDAWED